MSSKYMDIKEFREMGLLREANRQFFHPLGLALSVYVDDDGSETLDGVLDCREDPEGFVFLEATGTESADTVDAMRAKRREARYKLFGEKTIVQPLDWKSDN